MTGAEAILQAALLALQSPSPVAMKIKRSHRTPSKREDGNTVWLIDGDDVAGTGAGAKCGKRRVQFTTSHFVRDDEGASAADSLRIDICARFEAAPWPSGVVVDPPGKITVETEIADEDATRVDIEWYATYQTKSEWSLELAE